MKYFNQESKRLIYRALTEDDIESWIEFFEKNDKLCFLGLDLSKDYKMISTEWIMKQLERYNTQGLGHLAIIEKATNEFIGMSGILTRELNGKTEYEIAYSLKPKYWNKGFAVEAAMQMRKFGLENNIAQSFISIIDKNNLASIHVAEKNSMVIISETVFLGMNVFIYGDTN